MPRTAAAPVKTKKAPVTAKPKTAKPKKAAAPKPAPELTFMHVLSYLYRNYPGTKLDHCRINLAERTLTIYATASCKKVIARVEFLPPRE